MSASDLSQLAPPPSRTLKGEDAPLPLRENNGFDAAAFDAALLAGNGSELVAAGAGGLCADATSAASTPAHSNRDGANVVAALNFNAKRVPFSPFDEATDGKLGSVYTRVTEALLHRGDWDRRPALRNKATGELKLPGSYGLLLGTAQGKGVPWGRLGYGVWPPPLVNYCRGFDMLTRKGKMQSTLEQGREQFEGAWPPGMPKELTEGAAVRDPSNVWDLCPPSFVFHPSKGEANPRQALREAYAQRASAAVAKHAADPSSLPNGPEDGNRWILKPSEGAKGEGIFIENTLEAIEAHLDRQEAKAGEGEAVSSWVVQQYIHNPLLLKAGGRKFDMRCWVLVDSSYGIHLYRHGVLRVASARYDPNDVNNRFAHLTNHCIATEHEEYGKYEPTNELFYQAFDQELKERYPSHAKQAQGVQLFGECEDDAASAPTPPTVAPVAAATDDDDEPEDCVSSYRAPNAAAAPPPTAPSAAAGGGAEAGSVLEAVVLPQIRRHIVQTMLAARDRLECDGEYYRPFQLYGYDFLVDDDLRVWLCEINASPAVADELLPALVDDLIRTAVDPFFPPNDELLKEGREAYDRRAKEARAQSRRECFECLFQPAPKPEEPPHEVETGPA